MMKKWDKNLLITGCCLLANVYLSIPTQVMERNQCYVRFDCLCCQCNNGADESLTLYWYFFSISIQNASRSMEILSCTREEKKTDSHTRILSTARSPRRIHHPVGTRLAWEYQIQSNLTKPNSIHSSSSLSLCMVNENLLAGLILNITYKCIWNPGSC